MGHYDFQTATVDIDNDGVTIQQLSGRKDGKRVHEAAYIPARHIAGLVMLPMQFKIEIYGTNGEMTTTIKMPGESIAPVWNELMALTKHETR